ncbi:MAG: penicillin-binding protein 1C [Glaciecola sp.]
MNKKQGKLIKQALLFCVCLFTLSFILPVPHFTTHYSKVITAKDGELLGARIAKDGQWRFPISDPEKVSFSKFNTCILQFEDKHFYKHPGINPVSLFSAFKDNLTNKKRRGGSTITMQVARMMGGPSVRTYVNKCWEMLLALHLEVNLSKNEILNLYLSHAPFGGNVVGLEAASWRYFGRSPQNLSWSENALLAVLPNSPGLLYPGKGQVLLAEKRNRLLDKLEKAGIIDKETCKLSKLESVPGKPLKLPQNAQHVLSFATVNGSNRVQSTLDFQLQNEAQKVVNRHAEELRSNQVHNASAIIVEVATGNILVYIGNVNTSMAHANKVDVVKAKRSTGSILKPFLYACALDDGQIVPEMMLTDIPTYYAGYSPKNYYQSFDGVVKANEALYRSLNVPFVRMLQQYGIDRFYEKLGKLNMKSLNFPSDHYGLSLILGGAEVSLLELVGMYSGMARELKNFGEESSGKDNYFFPHVVSNVQNTSTTGRTPVLSAAAIHHTFEALTKVKRPASENGWKHFSTSRKVAWKTGTSFGNKDAWAVGVTPEYVVGVWAGNADGEGRTGLTGVSSAAPIMFELFNLLPSSTWFDTPHDELKEVNVCATSGYLAGEYCLKQDSAVLIDAGNSHLLCPFHQLVHLSTDGKYQVNQECVNSENISHEPWFVLPPVQEWYFKKTAPLYAELPPFHPSCKQEEIHSMIFAYPVNSGRVYIPKELNGNRGKVVFEIVHRNPNIQVYWHLDGKYLGFTEDEHKMPVDTEKGRHKMVVVDKNGVELSKVFEVLN